MLRICVPEYIRNFNSALVKKVLEDDICLKSANYCVLSKGIFSVTRVDGAILEMNNEIEPLVENF